MERYVLSLEFESNARKGNIEKKFVCVTVLCTIVMVHKDMSSSYRSLDCIRL